MAESDPTGIGRMMADPNTKMGIGGNVYTPEPPQKKKKSALREYIKMMIQGKRYSEPTEDRPPATR